MSETIEHIPIRECARRLGVSDTAVRKAIAAGRVQVAARHPTNDRPLLEWPAVRDAWLANTDGTKRKHVGGTGLSAERKSYGGYGQPALPVAGVELPPGADSDADDAALAALESDGDPEIRKGMSLAEATRAKAIIDARQRLLKLKQMSGELIAVADVKNSAFKVARTVRDALMNIPDRVASELAAETDPAAVHARLSRELREAIRELADVTLAAQAAQAAARSSAGAA